MISEEAYDVNKQTIYIALNSTNESRALHSLEPTRGTRQLDKSCKMTLALKAVSTHTHTHTHEATTHLQQKPQALKSVDRISCDHRQLSYHKRQG